MLEGSSPQRLLGFVALGVGGAGLLVGAVSGGLAVSRHGSLIDACPTGHCRPDQKAALQPDVDAYNTLGAVSTVGFLAGGVVAGAGVILLLTAPRAVQTREASASISIRPMLGPGYLGAQGSF